MSKAMEVWCPALSFIAHSKNVTFPSLLTSFSATVALFQSYFSTLCRCTLGADAVLHAVFRRVTITHSSLVGFEQARN